MPAAWIDRNCLGAICKRSQLGISKLELDHSVAVEEPLHRLVVMQATVDEVHVERSCARVEVLELVHPLDRDRVKECRDCSGCRDSKPKWDISASAIEQGPVIPRLEVARREVK